MSKKRYSVESQSNPRVLYLSYMISEGVTVGLMLLLHLLLVSPTDTL